MEGLGDRRGDRAEQLELARSREDQLKRALRSLEDQVAQAEALRAQQQAEEVLEEPLSPRSWHQMCRAVAHLDHRWPHSARYVVAVFVWVGEIRWPKVTE